MKKIHNKNIQQLIQLIKQHKTMCFGAGLQGRRVADFFENWKVSEQLQGFIDNSPSKAGQIVKCDNAKYRIYSLEEVEKTWRNEQILILVTCLNYKEIYEQLDKIKNNWIYISIDEVAEEQFMLSDYQEVIKESDKILIPKKIHYAWLGKEMPYNLRKNIEYWKQLCPEYEFYEWNEKNYDVSQNQYMKQAYEKKMWGFVTDYMRLDVIYKYGGIYLDTDIEMIRKPDELLYQSCFGCIDASLVMNLGSGFGAAPHAEIIRELRDYYDDVMFIRDDGSIDNTSCNTHSYNVLKKYGVQVNDMLQNVKGMNIYPMIFQGACHYTRKQRVTEKTYWVHYGNMSWFKKRG